MKIGWSYFCRNLGEETARNAVRGGKFAARICLQSSRAELRERYHTLATRS
jgi:hypothetical protein